MPSQPDLDGSRVHASRRGARSAPSLAPVRQQPSSSLAQSLFVSKLHGLFNFNDGTALRIFEHHTFVGPLIQGAFDLRGLDPGRVTSLALLPDGLRFVSGSEDHTACIAYHGLAPPL